MTMKLLNLVVTLDKSGLKDYYEPTFPSFSIRRGQKVQFDDDKNELIVKLPTGQTRKVRMSKSEMEGFTEYIF